jgi:hypothetical protein
VVQLGLNEFISCRNTLGGNNPKYDVEVGIQSIRVFSIIPPRHTPTMTKKLIVVGAGPVGCLAAIALANMGWEVEIYDARPGIPLPLSSPLSTFFHITVVTRYALAFFAGSCPTTID